MNYVVVSSLKDQAGTNIRERLLDNYPFEDTGDWYDDSPIYSYGNLAVVTSRKDIRFVEGLDQRFSDCNYIFVSKHISESGVPSLTAHFTGNFGDAAFGGNPREISRYSPRILKNYIKELARQRSFSPDSYKITIEATHHGPTNLRSPLMFVELGSSKKEWLDTAAARTIAGALVASLRSNTQWVKCAIGVGGTHYPEKMNKYLLDSEFAIGPSIPKYALEHFDNVILNQMISKSDAKVDYAIVDRKGLGHHKERVIRMLNDACLEIINV